MTSLLVVGLLWLPQLASAANVTGMGRPFAIARFGCSSDAGARKPSGPVVGDHPDAMVRVSLDKLQNRSWFWSIDLPSDPFVGELTEWGGSDGDRWWWPGGTIEAGTTASLPGAECGPGDPPASGQAEWFDRPRTPFAFSDPSIVHPMKNHRALSILGFVVSETGDYVADVRVAKAALDVYNPDYRISDATQNPPTSWKVSYRSPGTAGAPSSAGTLNLGHLEAGVHDLPFAFRQSGGGDLAIGVHLRGAASPPAVAGGAARAPLAPPLFPSATPAGTSAVVDGRARKRAVTLGVRRAAAIARSALSARLASRSTRLRCEAPSAQSPQSAHCRFVARDGRSVLEGQAIVTLPFGGARPRYRLTATVTQGGCRRRCVARPPQRAF